MLKERSTLANLLNDDSFVRWLKGEATSTEHKQWEDWLDGNDHHRNLKKRALKFISIPFKESQPEGIDHELEKLKKALSSGKETGSFTDD